MSVYAWADIHGDRALFDAVMNFLQPDDKVYFLGDAIDRGADGWEILKIMINDPRFIFIKGNHEDMMCHALQNFPRYSTSTRAMEIWGWNGNTPTLNGINLDEDENVKEILEQVNNLPTYAIYTNPDGEVSWLTHAGCDYVENGLEAIDTEDLIWDRSHFINNRWYDDNPDNLYIIHGHTPIVYLVEELSHYYDNLPEEIEPGAFYYAGGHKIDIDCGAVFTGVTVLLNLDTWDEEIFTTEDIS